MIQEEVRKTWKLQGMHFNLSTNSNELQIQQREFKHSSLCALKKPLLNEQKSYFLLFQKKFLLLAVENVFLKILSISQARLEGWLEIFLCLELACTGAKGLPKFAYLGYWLATLFWLQNNWVDLPWPEYFLNCRFYS